MYSTSHSGQSACGEHETALPRPALHRVLCRGQPTWPGEGVWEGLPRAAGRSGEGRRGRRTKQRTNERWREKGEANQKEGGGGGGEEEKVGGRKGT